MGVLLCFFSPFLCLCRFGGQFFFVLFYGNWVLFIFKVPAVLSEFTSSGIWILLICMLSPINVQFVSSKASVLVIRWLDIILMYKQWEFNLFGGNGGS